MSDVQALLARCRELGAEFTPAPDGKLKVKAPAPLPEALREELKRRKNEVLAALAPHGPYINARGELIIPCDCEPRYRYWAGGQSVAATLRELHAPPEMWARYTDVPYGQVQ